MSNKIIGLVMENSIFSEFENAQINTFLVTTV